MRETMKSDSGGLILGCFFFFFIFNVERYVTAHVAVNIDLEKINILERVLFHKC